MATEDVLKRIAAAFGCEPDDDDDLVEAAKELVRERDEARADLARSVAAWEAAGMQGRTAHDALIVIAEERDEALAIVDMLRGVGCSEDGDGPCGVCRKCAYRHGAEAMREACAKRAWDKIWDAGKRTDNLRKDFTAQAVRDALRALPIPEEP